MKRNYAIGIDFGGTNTKLGLMHASGRLLSESVFRTASCAKPKAFVRKAAEEIQALLERSGVRRSQVAGVGLGVPGPVDSVRGLIHTLVNVRGWDRLKAGALFRRHLRLPVRVENDVNAVALGEWQYGSARGCRNVVCITLGTGVGGGVILNGQLHRGASLTAGEIGHIVVQPRGPRCNCGSRGCLESLIGASNLLKRARAALAKEPKSILHRWLRKGHRLTPELLEEAVYHKDRTAGKIWDETAEYLGIVLAGVANLLNPEVVVVGGGISKIGEFFFQKVRKVVQARAMKVPAKKMRIVRSRLGSRAGVMGAASLVFQSSNRGGSA